MHAHIVFPFHVLDSQLTMPRYVIILFIFRTKQHIEQRCSLLWNLPLQVITPTNNSRLTRSYGYPLKGVHNKSYTRFCPLPDLLFHLSPH